MILIYIERMIFMFNLREFIKDMLNNGEDIDDSRKNYPLVIYENDIIIVFCKTTNQYQILPKGEEEYK